MGNITLKDIKSIIEYADKIDSELQYDVFRGRFKPINIYFMYGADWENGFILKFHYVLNYILSFEIELDFDNWQDAIYDEMYNNYKFIETGVAQ